MPLKVATGAQVVTKAKAYTPRKLKDLLGYKMVQVLAGKDLMEFSIYKDLICHYSPYFKAAFTSGFEESKIGIMKLPETEVDVFRIFYHWLYEQEVWDEKEEPDQWPNTEDLMKLYIFADMINVPALKNEILDALETIRSTLLVLPTSVFPYIWENTVKGSGIRRLIIDWLVWELDQDCFDIALEGYPLGFCIEVMKAAKAVIGTYKQTAQGANASPLLNMSNYHEH